jgi:hypothetical protein
VLADIADGQPGWSIKEAIRRDLRLKRDGRDMGLATVHRWIEHGARGPDGERVRLGAARTPSGLVTTAGAIDRFFRQLNGLDLPPAGAAQARREHEAAQRELDAAGL